MKTILLTGATGYLGSHLVREFLKEGFNVGVLKRSVSDTSRISDLLDELAIYDIDNGIEKAFIDMKHVDAIVHTATCYGRKHERISEIFQANLLLPLKVLEIANHFGVGYFFNTDTILDRHINPYALAKNQFRECGKFFAEVNDIHFVNVRLDHMYGPGDDEKKFTTYVIRSCLRGEKSIKLTKGDQYRDFIYIDDVVSAYIALLCNMGNLPRGYLSVDIGTGNPVKVRDFACMAREACMADTRLEFGALPYRKNELMRSCTDISYMKALGWESRYDIQSGIRETVSKEKAQP